eukprot:sb/3471597/
MQLTLLTALSLFSLPIFASVLDNPWGVTRIAKRDVESQAFSTNWALDRLNERKKILDHLIENVADGDLYVVGSGVSATHVEFGDRVRAGWSYFPNDDPRKGCENNDVSTGAASIGIGNTLGIAREAYVVPVKVHSCTSSYTSSSSLTNALTWITKQIQSNPERRAVILFAYHLGGSIPRRT